MTNTTTRLLAIIVRNEYLTDVRSKSFLISTFLIPIVMIIFGGIIGYLATDNPSLQTAANPAMPEADDLTFAQIMGMMVGIMMVLFIMMYGASIFNKVKAEKTNRVVEIMATCVPGRTMMMAKIVAVGLIGLTQLALWAIIIGIIVVFSLMMFGFSLSPDDLGIGSGEIILACVMTPVCFLGGYLFYGSLFAACGAMTDKNNENQSYMTILTFILLASFYLAEYIAGQPDGSAAVVFGFIPLFSPPIIVINALSGHVQWWITLLQTLVLYLGAYGSIAIAGKLYTSALLLMGRKFSPSDIITLIKTR